MGAGDELFEREVRKVLNAKVSTSRCLRRNTATRAI
jgi:hypothetical protein